MSNSVEVQIADAFGANIMSFDGLALNPALDYPEFARKTLKWASRNGVVRAFRVRFLVDGLVIGEARLESIAEAESVP